MHGGLSYDLRELELGAAFKQPLVASQRLVEDEHQWGLGKS
jgi:hypothetical protein